MCSGPPLYVSPSAIPFPWPPLSEMAAILVVRVRSVASVLIGFTSFQLGTVCIVNVLSSEVYIQRTRSAGY